MSSPRGIPIFGVLLFVIAWASNVLHAQSTSNVDRLIRQIGEHGRAGRIVEAPLVEQVVTEIAKEVGRRHVRYADALSLLASQYA